MRIPLPFSLRHPRLILGIVALLTVLSWTAIPRVHLALDARSLIPRGHPAMAAADRAGARFGMHDVVLIAVAEPRQGIYQPQALELVRRLSAEPAREPGIPADSVISLSTVPRLSVADDVIDLRPLLARGVRGDAALARRIGAHTHFGGLDDGVLVARAGKAAAILAAA